MKTPLFSEIGMDFKTYAVLPAAGTGERMGLPTPKQYCIVRGRPLITYTLQMFHSIEWIDRVLLAVSSDRRDYMQQLIDRYKYHKVQLLDGAQTRHRTIKKCIDSIPDSTRPDVVILHDAVRPFANEDVLARVSRAAFEHGASGAVQPLVSTVIAPTPDGFLDHCLVRSQYTASHTPQAFRFSVMKTAYSQATQEELDHGTESLQLALKYAGVRAKLIEDNGNIWKVTHARDLYAADGLAKETHSRVMIFRTDNSNVSQAIEEQLSKKGLQILSVCQDVSNIPKSANSAVVCLNEFSDKAVCMVEEIVSSLQAQIQYGGSVVMVVSNSNRHHTAAMEIRQKLSEFCQSLSVRLRPLSLCINAVCVTQQEQPTPDSLVNDVASMVAELVFNQSLVFSGQLFQLPC